MEVPVVVDRAGFHPIHVGALPAECALLTQLSSGIEELAIEGSLAGDPVAIYRAIAHDPDVRHVVHQRVRFVARRGRFLVDDRGREVVADQPAVELARQHKLRVGEGDALLVGEHGADAGTCLGVAGRERLQKLFRLFSLLREIRTIGEGTAEWR